MSGALAQRAMKRICARRSVILGYHGVAESRRRDDLNMLLDRKSVV